MKVCTYTGLTVDFCRKIGADYIVRGLRNPVDFQYEKDIAEANRQLIPEIETIFFASSPEMAHVSSSLVRELYHHQADYAKYVSFDL